MRVRSVHIYPVKATAPVDLTSAQVELAGLRDDRRWAVVDPHGVRLNATTHDRLLTVTATPDESGAITLTGPDRPSLVVCGCRDRTTLVTGPSPVIFLRCFRKIPEHRRGYHGQCF